MTRRERVLLTLLGVTAAAAVGLLGLQTWLDHLASLEQAVVRAQKMASVVQRQVLSSSAAPTLSSPASPLAMRLVPDGGAPEPMALAEQVRGVFARHHVVVQEFQVVSSDKKGFVLKYTLVGAMAPFLDAARELWSQDPQLIVTAFSASLREPGQYTLVWEVGRAAR